MRDLLQCEREADEANGAPYPEGRNPFGMTDVSVCGTILMRPPELDFLLAQIPQQGTYCEIGTWCAAGLAWIADRRPDVHCVGVDCFEGPPQRRIWPALANWDLRPNLDLYFGRVQHFSWRDNYFDVVLVDGDHAGEAVFRDLGIAAAIAKLAGRLFAHDYGEPGQPDVADAVDRFCAQCKWQIVGRAESLVLLERQGRCA